MSELLKDINKILDDARRLSRPFNASGSSPWTEDKLRVDAKLVQKRIDDSILEELIKNCKNA